MTETWPVKTAYDIATTHFHKWYGLLSATLLLWIVLLSIYALIPETQISFVGYSLFVFALNVVLLAYWAHFVWHYPRRSKSRLGIVVAVQVEQPADRNLFKSDFLIPFKNRIIDLELPFDVLVLKPHQSESIDTVDDARWVLHKTKAQFCVWGSLKQRDTTQGGERYLFSLRGIVVHRPIQEVQKVLLQKDFDALLPNTVAFERGIQFEAFNFRANQLFITVDYITGRAALLSGDYRTAITLHEPLYKMIERGQPCPIAKAAIQGLLSLEYDVEATVEFKKNGLTDDVAKSVKKSLDYDRNNYGALLKRGIVEFNGGRGNPCTSLRTIGEARKHAAGTYHWLYSKAFLHFWLAEYDTALQCCDKLEQVTYENEQLTVGEVCRFNEELLQRVDKPQLYYWLGFVNFVKRKNYPSADHYFQRFLDQSDNSMEKLRTRAESYLLSIKEEIGYK